MRLMNDSTEQTSFYNNKVYTCRYVILERNILRFFTFQPRSFTFFLGFCFINNMAKKFAFHTFSRPYYLPKTFTGHQRGRYTGINRPYQPPTSLAQKNHGQAIFYSTSHPILKVPLPQLTLYVGAGDNGTPRWNSLEMDTHLDN